MDVARTDTVDAELHRLISKGAFRDRRPDPDELEPGHAESVRCYNARREEENRLAWCEYHRGAVERLRATLGALVSYHEAEAERRSPKGAT